MPGFAARAWCCVSLRTVERRVRCLRREVLILKPRVPASVLNRIQIHFIVAMTQVISESANCTPGNLRLMQFGERTELHSRFGNLEKTHPDGVIRHTLLREHIVEAAAAREVILDLRDVVSDVLVACCGF